LPHDPFYGSPPSFEVWKAAQEKPAESWPECPHGKMRRKLAKQGFDYMGFYVCVRDDARCGVIHVQTSQVFTDWASEGLQDKE
jgi:hypothetical protein